MSIGGLIWILVQLLIGFNLLLPVIIFIIYIANKKSHNLSGSKQEANYALIVTAYESTWHLSDVVDSLLRMNYSNYLIYIVVDKCDTANLKFNHPRVIVLKPEEVLASNTRSHFYAINRFRQDHERVTIIDSDNLVHPEYLNELNVYFDQGFTAVQGTRAAKNLDTAYACLDAARDIFYHCYDGKLLFQSGSSATLAGSGMAFTTALYKECLEHLVIEGAGFDKVLQYEIVKRGNRIAYAENAIVYDEKTTKPQQLVNQRARWINSWFKYFVYGFTLLKKGGQRLNLNQFLFGLVLLRPPLFIFLVPSVLIFFINIFTAPSVAFIWLAALVLFSSSFLFSLIHSKADSRIYRSIKDIPRFIFYQLIALTKVRKANNISVATSHYHRKSSEPTHSTMSEELINSN
ncbi:MAG TPA: glycosyltransferase [Chitinophagaceae bacterium]|jgi:cellulose synthase/poly-beta-1,6-N-acetylglucosamine synthase-like glycosyltransferase|nr:glycosyltransferase [Chitinophagaceae bacterium]